MVVLLCLVSSASGPHQKKQDRDKRKEAAVERVRESADQRLLEAIKVCVLTVCVVLLSVSLSLPLFLLLVKRYSVS